MHACTCRPDDCNACPGRIVCHCLQVTEEALLEAVQTLSLRTVKEVRQVTGAGSGCTACQRRIRVYLEQAWQEELTQSPVSSSPSPI